MGIINKKTILGWSALVVVCIIGLIISASAVFIVALVLLGLVATGVSAYYFYNYVRNVDIESDYKIKAQTSFIRLSTADAEGYVAKAKSDEVRISCKKVYEALRYSDPMSTTALQGIEQQISDKMIDLSNAVASDNAAVAEDIATDIVNLVGDRNRLCKALK